MNSSMILIQMSRPWKRQLQHQSKPWRCPLSTKRNQGHKVQRWPRFKRTVLQPGELFVLYTCSDDDCFISSNECMADWLETHAGGLEEDFNKHFATLSNPQKKVRFIDLWIKLSWLSRCLQIYDACMKMKKNGPVPTTVSDLTLHQHPSFS